MAITSYLYEILIFLKKKELISSGKTKSIFEIGEQNWYGDVSFKDLIKTINNYSDSKDKEVLCKKLNEIISLTEKGTDSRTFSFDVAKLFYRAIFDYKEYMALDLQGTKHSINFDLNNEYKDVKKYDVVTNIGTSEHIFNQLAVFKTIHNIVAVGGLIIHQLPGQGYYDHGFYNYQPTFFFDLAKANNYFMIGFWMYDNNKKQLINVHNRENYVKLFVRENHPTYYDNIVIYKSPSEKKEEFKLPTQHIYSKTNVSSEEKKRWDANKK